MNFTNKKSFITFELLIVIVVTSIIIINSFISIKDIYSISKNDQRLAIYKLDLLSSKIILQKNKIYLNKLKYKNNQLFIDKDLFLDDVKDYKISINSKFTNISFKYKDSFDINWVIKR
ncbi:hypothetical protein CPU12_04570 [Malaciobacter molluscorum LMG 25693]|uniref:Prepilin-type cleavage/methylation domain-containing protein n=1 Tax=Malaciobacter molluscorum LMG 25693 TaxID=870501 RepID=A0A2G1DJ81_9BACT|nr:hypothetical protein [Malaciobacter molluscorum]AXX91647.1 hypothetical protein AMOL_0647 [Malaciobacter molluscorum LMG 25693]PHO18558.1 hypothetical protein CPU12_04570 [Malaciobacter molluscorum LMG 25693]RXJ94612.1 hypothetical protein CRV00_06705 [Malaciobacter molluscorum]